MKVLDEIKSQYNFINLQNGFRIEGIIDIYYKKKTGKISAFVLPTREWFYFFDAEEFNQFVISTVAFYEDNPQLKKTGKPLEDTDEIQFGMHRGEQLGALPPGYLLWLLDSANVKGRLLDYLRKNEKKIRMEAKLEKRGML